MPSPRHRRFDREVHQAAERYGVDPALIKAVIWRESAFRPDARGRSGEIGLMQIRELAAADWSSSQGVFGFQMAHLENPATNILAGTWYLARLLKRYEGTDDPVPYALADYNAGRVNVRRWLRAEGADTNSAVFVEQIGFPTTRKYVQAVMEQRRRYAR
jgi:soluble lytic murein transglycosylase